MNINKKYLHYQYSITQINPLLLYRVLQKSGPLKFFAVFSATVWDFNRKFYSCIWWNLLHLIVK